MFLFFTPRVTVLFDAVSKTALHNHKAIRHPLTAGEKKEEAAS